MVVRHAAVIAGGLSHEREVSLRSGQRVAAALRSAGLEVSLLDAGPGLLDACAAGHVDAAFIALHGGSGEDGSVQEVLAMAGIPFVGSPPAACRLAYDKPIAKAVLAGHGVPTPRWVCLDYDTFRDLGASRILDLVVAEIGLPIIVKPAASGSALGLALVHDRDDLPRAVMGCLGYARRVLFEEHVAGRELGVTVSEASGAPRALPAVEIVHPSGEPLDFAARYTAGAVTLQAPAEVSAAEAAALGEVALRTHEVLGLRHLSRVDILLRDAVPYVLEAAVTPGMTDTSLTPVAIEADGCRLGDELVALLERAAG